MPGLSYLYQFIVGGAIFLAGCFFSWRSGGYSWSNPDHRRTLVFILAGFVLYLVVQGFWLLFTAG